MNTNLLNNFLDPVIGVEPYESVFRSCANKIQSESPTLRWDGRREWMAFMRVHVMDYLARWPDAAEDLIDHLEHSVSVGRGRPSYRADVAAVLDAARAFQAVAAT
jgi:hypothetical protein